MDDRLEIRRRIAAGETFQAAAKAIGCSTKAIQRLLVKTGGMPPRSRTRSALRLSIEEREELSRGILMGDSLRAIAGRLKRAPSTLSREVRSAGGRGTYRVCSAEKAAAKRARRPKEFKLASNLRLRVEVEKGLERCWSPQQIAARLTLDHPANPELRVSHETIYRSLFVQARGALRKELAVHLRTGRTQRRPAKRTDLGGRILDMTMISERPAEVEDRAVPGHWEGDLIIGKAGRSAVGTLVERQSRYLMLLDLPNGRTAEQVRVALTKKISHLPQELRGSLTWDQGKEMAQHLSFTVDTKVQVYFCHPHSPWQRGSNENTNGLLRQYLPKSTDLSVYKRKQLNAIANELNMRPRKTLGWRTPFEVFNQIVASTG